MMRLQRVAVFVNLTAQFEKYFNKRENVEVFFKKTFDLLFTYFLILLCPNV